MEFVIDKKKYLILVLYKREIWKVDNKKKKQLYTKLILKNYNL